MGTRRLVAFAAALLFAGCSLDKQAAPPLTGPSELGLSLEMTATPDVLTQDGQSQSTIQITARSASSAPVSGLTLRADIYANGELVDFGTMSSKTVSTGSDGRASMVYRSPKAPSVLDPDSVLITVVATPVGSNYAATTIRQVELLLVRPGLILPPGPGPQASFIYSPTAPKVADDVFFDASGSAGSIVNYRWNYGDGRTDSSSSPTARHHFDIAGNYSVGLTVTDAAGRTASTTKDVTIGTVADPAASFVFSPTAPKPNDLVFFNGSQSKAAPGHFIQTYTWDFGDGSPVVSGGSALVNHPFAGSPTAGVTYVVTLQVTDDNGRTNSTSQNVLVTNTAATPAADPTASFVFSPTAPRAGNLVFFDGSLSKASVGHNITAYQFNFGDGTIVNGSSATTTHTFATANTYNVTLKVTDDNGRTNVINQAVIVAP